VNQKARLIIKDVIIPCGLIELEKILFLFFRKHALPPPNENCNANGFTSSDKIPKATVSVQPPCKALAPLGQGFGYSSSFPFSLMWYNESNTLQFVRKVFDFNRLERHGEIGPGV
jgi:hypothetical protein